MTILTSSSTFTITSGSVTVETIAIPILPGLAGGSGKGRLIHPTLGTLDYDFAPDEWVNIDADLIIEPIWASAKALAGSINTLWQGDVTDALVQEHWTQEVNVTLIFLRQLLAFWQNPPDPVTGTPVQWWPNYTSVLGFNVIIFKVEVGPGLVNVSSAANNRGITLNAYEFGPDQWVTEPVTLTMRILSRAGA
jgi:hypothetical protein